jgi:ribosomal protein S12 methylthiotransferase
LDTPKGRPPRIGLVILGCDKNTVDTEYLAASLARRGALVTTDPLGDAPVDAVVITTCGFTEEARRQSLETIAAWAERKRAAPRPMLLYVWSCMGQRWADDLLAAVPELDGIGGVGQFEAMAEAILRPATARARLVEPMPCVQVTRGLSRLRLDARPHAFLKIADGCSHACTFCAIPLLKGPLQSVPREILLEEARALLDSGARELNLIAQDVADYGRDLGDAYRLPDLLDELLALEGDFWVRLLYVYPGGLNEHLIELLAHHPKLCPYLDLPLQHLDPEVLARMRRPRPELDAEQLVERLRERIPDLALRTTMIVGFPGETRAAFERLLAGVRRIRFDRLGAFVFSPEGGTAAVQMPHRPSRQAAHRRFDRLMRAQADISAALMAAQVGRTHRVLVEAAGEGEGRYIGRTRRDAPEVDGVVLFHCETPLEPGAFVDVRITASDVYDLIGEAAIGPGAKPM